MVCTIRVATGGGTYRLTREKQCDTCSYLLKRDGRDHSPSMKQPAVVPSALARGSQPAGCLTRQTDIVRRFDKVIAKIKWFSFLPHNVDRLSLSMSSHYTSYNV